MKTRRKIITEADLEALAARINQAAGTPATKHTRQEDGTYKTNPGHHWIDMAYGGYKLAKYIDDCGSVDYPAGGGYDTKRECLEIMHRYLSKVINA